MKFIVLDEQSFRKYLNKSPYKSFMQTPEVAKLRDSKGWTSYYFGVEQDEKLIAASMMVAKPTFLGKSVFYAPGGLLVDYENQKVLSFFIQNLVKFTKTHNGYTLKIEPNYELIERDRDGLPVANGFNHEKAVKNLLSLGFTKTASENPTYAFVLDLKGREEKELFASFKQNTRNLISRTARKGIVVRELTKDELPLFKKITESTAERRDFSDKPLSYYEKMYDLFHDKGEVKFLVAEAPVKEQEETTMPDQQNDRSQTQAISAAMFMLYGDEVLYLFSGSDKKYMKEYNAQYAIQWYMIKYALSHGFKRYNFYGIQGLPDPKSPGYGIYLFKKGFGGHVTELIGAYELPVNQLFYTFHKLLSKLKHHH